jgi:transcriptional regulator NrdR family protein
VDCPRCAIDGQEARLVVRDTRQEPAPLRVTRRRVCERDRTHIYETVEHLAAVRLERLGVRRASDRKVLAGGDRRVRVLEAFSRPRLAEDIRVGVMNRLPEARVLAVVNDVIAALEEGLPGLLKPAEQAERFDGVIDDVDIVDVVELRLRQEAHETVRALYRLAKRPDKTTRDANAFLAWLADEGLYSREAIPDLSHIRLAQKWYPPAIPCPQPRSVLDQATGERSPFDMDWFQLSVNRTFEGRSNSKTNSYCTSRWVLWELAGQDTVLGSQLAVGVGQCLRRVDDIAYLRWAAVAKDLNNMSGLIAEAEALLQYPSRRLSFSQEAMANGVETPWHAAFPPEMRPTPTPEETK